jgi:KaiC/GvpD/RAD55 family RecA-like ATPase
VNACKARHGENTYMTRDIFPGSSFFLSDIIEVPSGASLLIGPPGSGKSVFCRQFAAMSLKEGQCVLAVLTDEPPNRFLEYLKKQGVDESTLKDSSRLKIIDAYSWRIKPASGEYEVSGLHSLHELSALIDRMLREMKRDENRRNRFIFDSFDAVVLNAGEESALILAQSLTARVAAYGFFGFITLMSGVHSRFFEDSMMSLGIGVVRLDVEVTPDSVRRWIRIPMFQATHITQPIEFKITEGKIQIIHAEKKK